jgi:hypothetical protein
MFSGAVLRPDRYPLGTQQGVSRRNQQVKSDRKHRVSPAIEQIRVFFRKRGNARGSPKCDYAKVARSAVGLAVLAGPTIIACSVV